MAQGDDAVAWARTQIGKPYKWGAAGPAAYDCSGLTLTAYKNVKPKVYLGRTTYEQIFNGSSVSIDKLAVGDLVFPYADLSHVALYSGGGNIIEAPRTGTTVHETAMYQFYTARRVGSVSGDDGGVDLSNLTTSLSSIPGIPNPLDPGGHPIDLSDVPVLGGVLSTTDAAAQTTFNIATFMRMITSKTFWLRFGVVSTGVALMLWGVFFLNRGLIVSPYVKIKRAGSELLGLGAQGAAFGIGAGQTGTGITRGLRDEPAPISGVPVTGPRAIGPSLGGRNTPAPNPTNATPSGMTNAEWSRRWGVSPDVGRFGKGPTPPPHKNPIRKGGFVKP